MRKSKFFNVLFLCVTILYALILCLFTCGVEPFTLLGQYWFEVFLFLIGFVLVVRAVLFKSDSSTIMGTVLFLNGIVFLVKNIYVLKFLTILPFIILTFVLAFAIAYFAFKNRFYLKAFWVALVLDIIATVISLVV